MYFMGMINLKPYNRTWYMYEHEVATNLDSFSACLSWMAYMSHSKGLCYPDISICTVMYTNQPRSEIALVLQYSVSHRCKRVPWSSRVAVPVVECISPPVCRPTTCTYGGSYHSLCIAWLVSRWFEIKPVTITLKGRYETVIYVRWIGTHYLRPWW